MESYWCITHGLKYNTEHDSLPGECMFPKIKGLEKYQTHKPDETKLVEIEKFDIIEQEVDFDIRDDYGPRYS